jgi:ATP-dependent Lhr-like helicase
VRTGDTPQRERQRQIREPAEILVTTPESLYLMLGGRMAETLARVHTIIVDEVHALVPSKRGAHLALSLERLCEITARDPQRIGLSATVRPLDEAAAYLGGDRQVAVVDTSEPPKLALQVTVPVADMERAATQSAPAPRGGSILGELYAREVGTPRTERGIWPLIYPAILEQIRANRSTLIFVNNRGLCERLCQRLNELSGEELVRAHHGSVSHEQRSQIEEGLKAGAIRGIVATSSLELGIDMGTLDLVILVESPGSVSRGLQRVGRAGHQVGERSAGQLFPKFRGDLLECAVVSQRMLEGRIESIRVPRNPLDVLAQQIVAACVQRPRRVADVERLVRRAYSYRELSAEALHAVLDMLSGRYPSSEFADLRPLLAWDRAEDLLEARRGAAMCTRLNAGTIPDRGNYAVHLATQGPRIGELDEEMVFEARVGETFLLGASSWRIEEITRDRVLVSPAPGEPGKLPFWRGDGPGRPLELGMALGAFCRSVGEIRERQAAVRWLLQHTPLDRHAAGNLAAYVAEQREHCGCLPSDRDIVIERFRDELGDWRVCILSPFGARLHAPWAMALQTLLGRASGFEVQVMYSDDGIVLRFADAEELPGPELLLPDPEEVEELVTQQLAQSALFAGIFRENAVRSLLLTRRRVDQRTPLWAQRLKARQLLATVQRYPSFPLLLETYRHCLADVFDLPGLRGLLRKIRSREVRVHEVETRSASPFARSLVFAYVAAYIYEQDSPLAEHKAQALTLDRTMLGELLGQSELRELIDPNVLADLEAELQALSEDRRARDAHELHDLLRRLGDLSESELALRCTRSPEVWLEVLKRSRRACQLVVAAEPRWVAAEDAAIYRDALGAMPPSGLPDSLLAPVEDAVERLARRYARTHGPFLTRQFAGRYRLPGAQAELALASLEKTGTVVRGELRPGGVEREWCDVEVLRRLKRRTLAKLRDQVSAVASCAYAEFLIDWHGLRTPGRGPQRLLEVVSQLEGLALPWSSLCGVILPQRVADFRPEMLDTLCASGEIVWVGCGALGAADGRVALFRRERARHLLPVPPAAAEFGALHQRLMEHLQARGACFLVELEQGVRVAGAEHTGAELRAALWDLVWAGLVTNDTVQPLRTLGARPPRPGRGRRTGAALGGGRWSLVADLREAMLSDTERAVAIAEMLLERYGIVSREGAAAEDLPGGFGAVYGVLKAMEEAGRLRRGYFVEGLSGAQFAHAGAVDRLRAGRQETSGEGFGEEDLRILAALDPAQPYGSLIPWPSQGEAGKPRRVSGAWVIMVAGWPRLFVGPGGRQLISMPNPAWDDRDALALALNALSKLPRAGRRRLLVIERVDGIPVQDSPLAPALRAAGFVSDYRGMSAAGA